MGFMGVYRGFMGVYKGPKDPMIRYLGFGD